MSDNKQCGATINRHYRMFTCAQPEGHRDHHQSVMNGMQPDATWPLSEREVKQRYEELRIEVVDLRVALGNSEDLVGVLRRFISDHMTRSGDILGRTMGP